MMTKLLMLASLAAAVLLVLAESRADFRSIAAAGAVASAVRLRQRAVEARIFFSLALDMMAPPKMSNTLYFLFSTLPRYTMMKSPIGNITEIYLTHLLSANMRLAITSVTSS